MGGKNKVTKSKSNPSGCSSSGHVDMVVPQNSSAIMASTLSGHSRNDLRARLGLAGINYLNNQENPHPDCIDSYVPTLEAEAMLIQTPSTQNDYVALLDDRWQRHKKAKDDTAEPESVAISEKKAGGAGLHPTSFSCVERLSLHPSRQSNNLIDLLVHSSLIEEKVQQRIRESSYPSVSDASVQSIGRSSNVSLEVLHAVKQLFQECSEKSGLLNREMLCKKLKDAEESRETIASICAGLGGTLGPQGQIEFDNNWNRPIHSTSVILQACRQSTLAHDDRVRFVFDLFDTKKQNRITREQVYNFFLASIDSNNVQFYGIDLDDLVDTIFKKSAENSPHDHNSSFLSYEQFEQIFKRMQPENRFSVAANKGATFTAGVGNSKNTKMSIRCSTTNGEYGPRPLREAWYVLFYRKNRIQVHFYAAYFFLNTTLFFWKFFTTANSNPVLKYGLPFAKACAIVIMLNCALLLLAVCREFLVQIRQLRFLWNMVPFDELIDFHKVAGITVVVATAGHCIAWLIMINSIRNADEPAWEISGLKALQVLRNGSPNDILRTLPLWTGIAMLLCLLIALPFTIQRVKRTNFNAFWYTHMLLFPFVIFLGIHGAAAWTNAPQAYMWILIPTAIYFFGRRHRFGKIFGGQSKIVNVHVATDVVALFLEKPKSFANFKAGMYLFLNVPVLSRFEWHPFTISSAPQDEYLSLHIRRNGDWTNALHSLITSINHQSQGYEAVYRIPMYPEILIDGPIGAPTQQYRQYEIVTLIGGGIGVTPFASILKDVLNTWNQNKCENCHEIRHMNHFQLKKIYFYWVTREQESLSWFSDTMNYLSTLDRANRLEIHNYFTPLTKNTITVPLQLFQTFIHQEDGHDIISGLTTKTLTHFGRPDWEKIFTDIRRKHPQDDVGVFLCGPKALESDVSGVLNRLNSTSRVASSFELHVENFS